MKNFELHKISTVVVFKVCNVDYGGKSRHAGEPAQQVIQICIMLYIHKRVHIDWSESTKKTGKKFEQICHGIC